MPLIVRRRMHAIECAALDARAPQAEVAEDYMGTEKAVVWIKQGRGGEKTPAEVDIPYQGSRVLFAIDGGSSARNVTEYSAEPQEDEVSTMRRWQEQRQCASSHCTTA